MRVEFDKQTGRRDAYNPLNENRFENINKSPAVLSSTKRTTGLNF